ncbi:hypothetical protein OG618_37040 (plasmid) [Kitasatospora sp. NBC_01246]|uniref:hypothetical protein n=1 Tax=Kitasatospora sp. NBC_01246 TaxID=2903570 RepID=UPI002E36B6AF|nr:hypothetical protein [Kitasatospora sp. NBC_01246]
MFQVQLLVVAHASHARGLRERVLHRLAGWGIGLDAEASDTVRVVVSNLFAAALLHGVRGQTVTVRLSATRGELTVEVITGVTTHTLRRPRGTVGTGRLPVALAVYATASGVTDRPRGRTFWATVPVPTRHRRTERAAPLRCRLPSRAAPHSRA